MSEREDLAALQLRVAALEAARRQDEEAAKQAIKEFETVLALVTAASAACGTSSR